MATKDNLSKEEIESGKKLGMSPEVLLAVRDPKNVQKLQAANKTLGPKNRIKLAADSGVDDWQAKDDWQTKEGAPADLLKKFNEAGYKTADPGYLQSLLSFGGHALNRGLGGNLEKMPAYKRFIEESNYSNPTASSLGDIGGEAALVGGNILLPGGAIAKGAAQGALTNPGETASLSDELKKRLSGGVIGGGTAAALSAAGSGLKKGADWAMQKAVQAKEYIPGLGNRIADEGLIGTRDMMLKQVAKKLPAREAALQGKVSQVQGSVPAKASEDAINRIMGQYVPAGNTPIDPGNVPRLNAGMERLQAITQRGDLSPQEALDAFRKIDRGLYDTQNAREGFSKYLAKADTGAGREALKGMADAQGLNEVRDLLGREQALISARNSLDTNIPLRENLIRHGRRGAVGSGIGLLLGHGNPMAIPVGIAATEAASTPLALSALAQGANLGGKAAPILSPAVVDQILKNYSNSGGKDDWSR